MLILALDTTTRTGSAAVARDGVVLREMPGDASRPLAVRLPGDLVTLLKGLELTLRDLDAFAVATGPGSFTGLRVGIASMQGLAFAEHKPLIGVSALDALATLAFGIRRSETDPGAEGSTWPQVATWVDAWRGDVYAAMYVSGQQTAEAAVARPVDLLEAMDARETLFIGDGAATFRTLIVETRRGLGHIADPADPPLAGTIARLAFAAWASGHRPPPDAIRPLYVRRPDVVLTRERVTDLGATTVE